MRDIPCEIETKVQKIILKNSHKNQTSTEPSTIKKGGGGGGSPKLLVSSNIVTLYNDSGEDGKT
jgi:hypothetical protein